MLSLCLICGGGSIDLTLKDNGDDGLAAVLEAPAIPAHVLVDEDVAE